MDNVNLRQIEMTQVISFKLTDTQKAYVKQCATEENVNASTWIRRRLFGDK